MVRRHVPRPMGERVALLGTPPELGGAALDEPAGRREQAPRIDGQRLGELGERALAARDRGQQRAPAAERVAGRPRSPAARRRVRTRRSLTSGGRSVQAARTAPDRRRRSSHASRPRRRGVAQERRVLDQASGVGEAVAARAAGRRRR